MSELSTVPGTWDIHYEYAVGDTAAAFFQALRDEETILGSRCDGCGRTLVPARSFCERCFVPISELTPVGRAGVVTTFTRPAAPVEARSESFTVIGLITLDGATSGIPHFLGEVDDGDPETLFERVREGLRVEALFRPPEQRQGNILDIRYFRPVR